MADQIVSPLQISTALMGARWFAAISLLLTGAIFGFFYAYSVSVIWGLDDTDPLSAIHAMQGINRMVRNMAFAPAFFGTPVAMLVTAAFAYVASRRRAAFCFALAAITYVGGAFLPTMLVNVPMNQALAIWPVPADAAEVAAMWRNYADTWLFWNHVRMSASGLALLVAGNGIFQLAHR